MRQIFFLGGRITFFLRMRGAVGFGEKENPLEDFFFFFFILGGVGRKTRERNKKKKEMSGG